MISQNDNKNTVEHKNYFVILPNSEFIGKEKKKKYLKLNKTGKTCSDEFSYNSKNNKDYLSVNQLKRLIKNNQKDFEL